MAWLIGLLVMRDSRLVLHSILRTGLASICEVPPDDHLGKSKMPLVSQAMVVGEEHDKYIIRLCVDRMNCPLKHSPVWKWEGIEAGAM